MLHYIDMLCGSSWRLASFTHLVLMLHEGVTAMSHAKHESGLGLCMAVVTAWVCVMCHTRFICEYGWEGGMLEKGNCNLETLLH